MQELRKKKDDSNRHVDTEQYLTFIMANEEYGVDILSVVEIRGWETPTPLPAAPAYVKGVINLRGTIVPVIDLRQRFHMAASEYGQATVIIVLSVVIDNKKKVMGVITDAVSDVYTVNSDDVKDPPEMGSTIGREYLKGLVTITHEEKQKMVILLDVDKLLAMQDLDRLISGGEGKK